MRTATRTAVRSALQSTAGSALLVADDVGNVIWRVAPAAGADALGGYNESVGRNLHWNQGRADGVVPDDDLIIQIGTLPIKVKENCHERQTRIYPQ
jgi:hypothetical protein